MCVARVPARLPATCFLWDGFPNRPAKRTVWKTVPQEASNAPELAPGTQIVPANLNEPRPDPDQRRRPRMKLLDRLLIASYIKAYVICLVSMLGLYVVVDLFTNIEDFTQHHSGLGEVLTHIGRYYGYKVTQIFDRLSEAIVLLAAMFTIAWVQRSNELLPLLSAGVATRRVVRPVLLSAVLFLGLTVLNQELVIPQVANYLMNNRDDPDGEKDIVVQGAFEPNGIHIHGEIAKRRELTVLDFSVLLPEAIAGNDMNLHARKARYVPGKGPRQGGWLLTDTEPPEIEGWAQT